MGSHVSKRPAADGGAAAAAAAGGSNGVHYGAGLRSYSAACQQDPELQSLDTTIQQRMSRAISSLAVGVEVRALSLDSLREVTSCLLDMNQEVVKVILQCRKDIWKSPELFSLVEDYFESSLQTLDFCTALEKCLKRARDSQLIVHVALQRFEDEQQQPPPPDAGHKYHRTLQELKSFKASGDPFTEEFFHEFQSVYKQQLLMLERLQIHKSKLDKKLNTVKAWRKISGAIFVSTCAAVLICSVVAAAMAAPPVAAALAAAASVPVGSMGKWIDSLWKRYEDALKSQKQMISSMQVGSYIVIKDLDNIRVLVDRLEIEIKNLIGDVNFAMKGDDTAVKIAVEEIQKRLDLFMKGIEELGEQADQCSRDIRRARTVVLQKIIKHPE